MNKKQCTIGWYVDDNLAGHVDEQVIDNLLQKIKTRFPGLVVQKGPKLEFLDMELFFRDGQKMDIGTVQFLINMIIEFVEETGVSLNRS